MTAAIAALGTSYTGVTAHEGLTAYSEDGRDGAASYRQWGWIAQCSCFRYVAEVRPFGR